MIWLVNLNNKSSIMKSSASNTEGKKPMVQFLDEKRISLSSFKKEEQIKGMSKSDIKEFKS